jgi:O-antigen ligase
LGAVEVFLRECGDELAGAVFLNQLSWVTATIILGIIVYVGREHLAEETSQGLSGYTIDVRMRTVAGMAMVRSTGISRFAGAIAIVAWAAVWRVREWTRIAWVALFAGCVWLIWLMQSRGSLSSFLAALAVMTLLLGRRARVTGIIGLTLAVAAVGLNFVSHDLLHFLWVHITRNDQHLTGMDGRVYIFQDGWSAILRAPILGYGPQADHRITYGNAQDGLLYALLCGGFVGGGAWALGFALVLSYLVRVSLRWDTVAERASMTFVQVAGLMVFFTLRTFPENCAALFSVDLMLQLPAMVYLGALNRCTNF